MNFLFVYITAKDREQARAIGRALVEQRIAACVNILDGMRSIYRWEGRVVEESEAVLIAKTRESSLEKLTATVKALHSYDCPCVAAFPIVGGNNDYLAWLGEETG